MRFAIVLLLPAIAAGAGSLGAAVSYPATRTTNQVDVYHGVTVADPFRWLEDDNAPETRAWVAAQNRVTFDYLKQIPQRDAIHKRMEQLWNYERYSVPFQEGGSYFFTRNDGLQNQSVLYTLSALEAPPRLLLDPNKLSADGTMALAGMSVSHDGHYLAYGISAAGSDWEEWKIRDVRTGQDTEDDLKWVKFSGAAWTKDGTGIFYCRYDEPAAAAQMTAVNYYQKLYFHRLGTPQSADQLIYHRDDFKDWGFGGGVTDDGHYLIITISQGTDPRDRVYYLDLTKPGASVVELLNEFDAQYDFIDNDGPAFWFRTDLGAPRGRIIAIDITKPERANWRQLVPQAAET